MLVHYFTNKIKNKRLRFLVFAFIETVFIGLTTVLLSYGVFGFEPGTDYHGVKIKTYGNITFNITQMLDAIPLEYYEHMTYIKLFEKRNPGLWGLYWMWGGIDIFDANRGNVKETLVHELAHHCQLYKGDMFWQMMGHEGRFEECYDEIYDKTEWS